MPICFPSLVCAIVLAATVHAEYDVERFISFYNELNAPSYQPLDAIKNVITENTDYVQSIPTVGSLIALGLKTAFSPSSAEQKSITLLHKAILAQFEIMASRLRHLSNELAYSAFLSNYQDQVRHHLNIMKPIVLRVSSPSAANRSSWKNEFLNHCTSTATSPIVTLNWLHQKTYLDCKAPMKWDAMREAEIVAKLYNLFHRIERGFQQFHLHLESFQQYQEAKFETMLLLMKMEDDIAQGHINTLEKIVEASSELPVINLLDEMNAAFGNIIQNHRKADEDCLFDMALVANQHKRSALDAVVEMVKADLIQLIKERMEEIKSYGEDISGNLAKWYTEKLIAQWPSITREFVKQVVGGTYVSDWQRYPFLATSIKEVADNHGPPSYFHQSLVLAKWNGDFYFFAPCMPENCLMLYAFQGIHVIVSRFEEPFYGVENKLSTEPK